MYFQITPFRNAFTSLGIEIKDKKDGFDWEIKGTT